ncbi:MAG: hypothetical protein GDA48_14000 [Hormoscilla sp. GM102CHS1]|nr:hypothetical protein [Hormoscilla sp. SP12CHS1]MBC6473781.1 hypothetical protein [Hormoscilla sp. GM102CHS1]
MAVLIISIIPLPAVGAIFVFALNIFCMGVPKKSIPQFPWLYEPVHPDDWIIFRAAAQQEQPSAMYP